MTGQAQQQGIHPGAIQERGLRQDLGLFDCASGIKIDVKTYAHSPRSSTAKPIDANGNLLNNFGYHAGRPRPTSWWCG